MSAASADYIPGDIEPKWQQFWQDNETFKTEAVTDKPKYYVLDMFPYPSAAGLHVGHPEGYTATDIVSRYKRMRGYNVLHPMGWDAFGLPAEQHALETGAHPAVTTKRNIDTFRRQIKSLGFSYDWSREIATCDPKYYRWTQWIFMQLHKQGLAYIDEAPVNWCPALGTVLANEEVINGLSERGSHPVVRRPMKQWMLKITAYADRLLQDLEELDWPEGIKEMQRNWIGRSEGAEVDFKLVGKEQTIRVYTTRPDTLFGATYMVLAPEHPLVAELVAPAQAEAAAAYRQTASRKSELERTELNKEKTGVYLGIDAVNPVNGEAIPVWISDYVMMGYGTGAIMSVPAHDTRDFEFAELFGLEIRAILEPDAAAAEGVTVADVVAGKACWTGEGRMIRSANADGLDINGMAVAKAVATTCAWLEAKGFGRKKVNYKLRDWLFSRQHYWGEPFPIVHMEDGEIKLLGEDELPLALPEADDYRPSGNGESPLANVGEWLDYTEPKTGRKGRRETNTMPQWAGSCWYYLRFLDAANDNAPWDKELERYWMPVDLYVGGAEHAVLHLLYARFWHKVLYDIGWVTTKEPFAKLVNQGMILGTAYRDGRGVLVPNDQVEEKDGRATHVKTGEELTSAPAKMSKSLKNVVNPDDVVAQYGADSFRLYEMFMGPLQDAKPWDTHGVEGVNRFLRRAWRMVAGDVGGLAPEIGDEPMSQDQLRLLHQTIKKVGDDIESVSNFNTAISQLMIFVNEFSKAEARSREAMVIFVKLLAPLAPHIAEELWERLGNSPSIANEPWPEFDPAYLLAEEVEILVQVMGKPKDRLMMPPDLDPEAMGELALASEAVQAAIAGKNVRKIISVPGRLVNIVAN